MSNPINPEYNNRAVSVYGSSDALDDFPVLKAFQQYIDAEQAKARKRLLAMGIFFGALMFVVIAIFVILLMNVSNRNQQLNDRLVEFAMKERSTGSAVVVQPPQDSTAILALTAKLEDLQHKLADAQSKADKAVADAEEKVRLANASVEAAKPKEPTPEEREIQRLKAQLAAERERATAEKERRREEELEAYRRKHYPELYAPKQPEKKAMPPSHAPHMTREAVDQILDDLDRLEAEESETPSATDVESAATNEPAALAPINYFDDDDETQRPAQMPLSRKNILPQTEPKTTNGPTPLPATDTRSITVKSGDLSVSWGIPD